MANHGPAANDSIVDDGASDGAGSEETAAGGPDPDTVETEPRATTGEEAAVEIISPNLPVEAAVDYIEPPAGIGVEDVRLVGQPKFLFDTAVTLKRRFLSDRDAELSVTVDALTGGRMRNDEYPDLETRELPKSALIEPRFRREAAFDRAKSTVRRYISFHFSSYVILFNFPEIEVRDEAFAYHLYWLVPTDPDLETVTIMNSVTGDVVERDVNLDDVDAETFAADAEDDPGDLPVDS